MSSSSRTDFHKSLTRNCFSRSIACNIAPSIKRFHTLSRIRAEGRQHAPCFSSTNAQISVQPASHCAEDTGISTKTRSRNSARPNAPNPREDSSIGISPSSSPLRRSYRPKLFSRKGTAENPPGGTCSSNVDLHFAIAVTASSGRFKEPLSPASSSTTLMSALEICPRLGRRIWREFDDCTWRMR